MNRRILLAVVAIVAAVFIGRKLINKNKTLGVSELHVYIWSNYVDPEVYKIFEKETGVKIVEEIMDSNEALESKLQMGNTGYDLVVPSDYAVQKLAKQNLLAPINLKNVPNAKNLSPFFAKPYYDPELSHSIPYLWGSTGIGYTSKHVTETVTGWANVFDPEKIKQFQGKISLLDDPREAIGAALKYKGHSINTTDPAHLEEAKQVLLAQKPFVGRYDSDSYRNFLLSGDLYLSQSWSGDILRHRKENPDLNYVIPAEGSVIWADNFAIPRDVKSEAHKEAAESFINFMLRDDISARVVNFVHYPSTIETAKKLVAPEILNNPSVYPGDDVLAKLEWMRDVGEANELYEKIWNEVKSN